MFIDRDESRRESREIYVDDPGFDKMKKWADGIVRGGKQPKRRYINKSKKRTNGKKSKTSKKNKNIKFCKTSKKNNNKKSKKYRK